MTRQELIALIRERRSFLCVGLDTDPAKIPEHLRNERDGMFRFNRAIIDATIDYSVAYKPNLAFYEALGLEGLRQLKLTMDYIHGLKKPVFTIADAKRGDIGNTSERYAKAFLDPKGDFNFDHLVYYDYDRRITKYGYDIYHSLKENTSESDFANWEPWFRKAVPYSRFSAKWLSSMNQLIADMQVFSESTQDYGMVSMFFPRQIYNNAGLYSSYRILNLNTAIQAFEWNSVIRWQQYGW